MERIEDIDRQLDALGSPSADLSGALERVLGKDRSLAKLDELLSGLGEVPQGMLRPRMPSLLPPRRSPLPPRIVSPLPSLASPMAEIAAPAAWPARPTPQPAPAPAPAPVVAALPPLPRITDTLVDSPFVALPPIQPSDEDLDAETAALLGEVEAPPAMPSAVPLPFGPSVEMAATSVEVETRVGPPPEEIEAAAQQKQEQARERRDSVRALLEQEIDPNDFPSERPPKDEGDDVEMLLEDDEILEIEDDELLEDEGTS